ncbi:MAG: glycosyltransferase family 39 protein [bacterium]|nr:glycosyltransferase family 39 protein [bacterium]
MSKKITLEYLLLTIILVLSFVLRLYRIDNPVADWHSWRQADTSSVSRNFLKFGFDIFHPRFDDLSSLPSGMENPQGYRMVEFPAYNLIQAGIAQTFPQKSIEWWGRMVSVVFSLGSLLILYLIVKKFSGSRVGFFAAFFFGVLPYSIYFSRVILPEPMMIFSALIAIYFFTRWLEDKKFSIIFYFLSIIFAILTLLIKPFAVFLFLPLAYLVWEKWQLSSLRKPLLYLYFFLAFLPFALWRVWISQYPEGIPNWTWLLNEGNIRFKGAFFRWIYGERISKLILGFWGLPLLIFGLLKKTTRREGYFFHFWFLGAVLYFSFVAGGNVHHDYYQILAIPAISILLAKGADFLLTSEFFNRSLGRLALIVMILFMLAFSWYEVKGDFNINHPEIVRAGKAVDNLVPKMAKVIAPYSGDTAFLYQTNRQGWPIVTDEISVNYLISRGATHYVSVNFDKQTKDLMEKYKILKQTDEFVILDLNSPK